MSFHRRNAAKHLEQVGGGDKIMTFVWKKKKFGPSILVSSLIIYSLIYAFALLGTASEYASPYLHVY